MCPEGLQDVARRPGPFRETRNVDGETEAGWNHDYGPGWHAEVAELSLDVENSAGRNDEKLSIVTDKCLPVHVRVKGKGVDGQTFLESGVAMATEGAKTLNEIHRSLGGGIGGAVSRNGLS